MEGQEAVSEAASRKRVDLSVPRVFFSSVWLGSKMESSSCHEKGNRCLHPGSHAFVCLVHGLGVGEKGLFLGEKTHLKNWNYYMG